MDRPGQNMGTHAPRALFLPQSCIDYAKVTRPKTDMVGSVQADFEQIEPYLPERCDSIIDVGCGLAAIDVLLKRRYPEATLTLVDSDGDEPFYAYQSRGKPYGSRAAAEEMLSAHGIDDYRWLPAGTRDLRADLVISLLFWGFHYPLSVYDVQGYCIADLRKPNEPARGVVIAESAKYNRCAFTC